MFLDELLEAAKALQDEYILVNIRGQNLVVIEVRYHRSCYKDYTGFLVHQKGNNASGNQSYTSYKKAFEVFCSTVNDTCIFDKLQILRMVSLQELFIKTMREVENLDDSVKIRGFYLKQKLNARYPLLQFCGILKEMPVKFFSVRNVPVFLLTGGRLNLIWRNLRAPIVNMTMKAKGHYLDKIIIVKNVVESYTLPVNIFKESSFAHQL